jgi:hypothetical protein
MYARREDQAKPNIESWIMKQILSISENREILVKWQKTEYRLGCETVQLCAFLKISGVDNCQIAQSALPPPPKYLIDRLSERVAESIRTT